MYLSKAGSKVRSQKDRIIKMHLKGNIRMLDIAKKYNMTESTMYKYFRNWGVKILRGRTPYQKRGIEDSYKNVIKCYNKPMKISLKLKAQRRINQKINDSKVHFFRGLVNVRIDSQDARLIRNICYKAYI